MVGVKTLATSNLNEICEKCATHPIEIVLVDVEYPQYGGIYLVRYLKQQFPRLTMILLVSEDDIGIFSSFDDSATQILSKPLDLYGLHTYIQKISKTKPNRGKNVNN